MRATANRLSPCTDPEPPASLRPFYEARRARSLAAVRAAIRALAAEGRRVTLAAIERVSHGLPEGAVTAKTVLRNPECRALYAVAAGTGAARKTHSSQRALRAELATVNGRDNGSMLAAPSAPNCAGRGGWTGAASKSWRPWSSGSNVRSRRFTCTMPTCGSACSGTASGAAGESEQSRSRKDLQSNARATTASSASARLDREPTCRAY